MLTLDDSDDSLLKGTKELPLLLDWPCAAFTPPRALLSEVIFFMVS